MCSLCLPQLYKNPAFVECPTCRQISNVRLEDVPKNRDILEFLEFIKAQQSTHTTNDNNNNESQSALPQPRYSPTPSHSSHESSGSTSTASAGFRSELQLPVYYNNHIQDSSNHPQNDQHQQP
jgi:hypothetical protein